MLVSPTKEELAAKDAQFLIRYWAKVELRDPEECWPWLSTKRGGYGLIYGVSLNAIGHLVTNRTWRHLPCL